MEESNAVMNFRVDAGLKKAFERVAKNNDLSASQMIRAYMRSVVETFAKEKAQGDLLEPAPPPKKAKRGQAFNTIPRKRK